MSINDKESTIVHEVGHLIICLAFNIPTEYLKINEIPWSETARYDGSKIEVGKKFCIDVNYLFLDVVLRMAGVASEVILLYKHNDKNQSQKFYSKKDVLKLVPHEDQGMIEIVLKKINLDDIKILDFKNDTELCQDWEGDKSLVDMYISKFLMENKIYLKDLSWSIACHLINRNKELILDIVDRLKNTEPSIDEFGYTVYMIYKEEIDNLRKQKIYF